MRAEPARFRTVSIWIISLGAVFGSAIGCSRDKLESDLQQQSYAVGFKLGQQLQPVKNDIDPDVVARGLKDGISGTSKLDDQAVSRQMVALQQKQRSNDDQLAKENLAKSLQYIADVSKKPNVKLIEDGLVIEEINPGSGSRKALKDDDLLQIRYRGKRIDGSVFDDASAPSGVTVKFQNLLLPGLKKAIQRMPVGAEWVLHLAPSQGYGDAARPGVARQSALVYELTFIGVRSKK